jgi:AcrR family transcriptional regulator
MRARPGPCHHPIVPTAPAPPPAENPRSRLSAQDWVEAGLALLGEEGLEALKIDALADRLGVTKGSFYWHFKSLAVFREALVDGFIARQRVELGAFDPVHPMAPRERLLALMHHISAPDTARLERVFRGWAYGHARLARHVWEVDHWAHGVVKGAFIELGFSAAEAELRAKSLYYTGVGRVHTGILGEPEDDEMRVALLDLLTRR